MKLAGFDANIVHFGPEYGVLRECAACDHPHMVSTHGDQWAAAAAAEELRSQGKTPLIRKRMVYHSGWEPVESVERVA